LTCPEKNWFLYTTHQLRSSPTHYPYCMIISIVWFLSSLPEELLKNLIIFFDILFELLPLSYILFGSTSLSFHAPFTPDFVGGDSLCTHKNVNSHGSVVGKHYYYCALYVDHSLLILFRVSPSLSQLLLDAFRSINDSISASHSHKLPLPSFDENAYGQTSW